MDKYREVRKIGMEYPVGQWLQEIGTNMMWVITGVGVDIHDKDNTFYFNLHCPARGTEHYTAFREDISLGVLKKHYVKSARGE